MIFTQAYDFSARIAVVTGGSGVLCGTMAEALGAAGARVVVVGHNRMEAARAVADRIVAAGGAAMALQADVMDRGSMLSLRDTVLEHFGPADILINGAGGAKKEATTSDERSFFDLPEEAVRWVFDLNFLGTFFASQIFARDMVEMGSGAILNIGSLGGERPLTRSVAYSAAKAAVTNFTQWLAIHLSMEYSSNIRVNALVPGFFLTEQNRFLLTSEDSGELTARGSRIIDHTPMGRFGQPADLIGPALFMLSSAAGFVHGTTLVVDGGLSGYGGV